MHGVDRCIEVYPEGIPTNMRMILIGLIERLSLFKILVEETIPCIIMKVLLLRGIIHAPTYKCKRASFFLKLQKLRNSFFALARLHNTTFVSMSMSHE